MGDLLRPYGAVTDAPVDPLMRVCPWQEMTVEYEPLCEADRRGFFAYPISMERKEALACVEPYLTRRQLMLRSHRFCISFDGVIVAPHPCGEGWCVIVNSYMGTCALALCEDGDMSHALFSWAPLLCSAAGKGIQPGSTRVTRNIHTLKRYMALFTGSNDDAVRSSLARWIDKESSSLHYPAGRASMGAKARGGDPCHDDARRPENTTGEHDTDTDHSGDVAVIHNPLEGVPFEVGLCVHPEIAHGQMTRFALWTELFWSARFHAHRKSEPWFHGIVPCRRVWDDMARMDEVALRYCGDHRSANAVLDMGRVGDGVSDVSDQDINRLLRLFSRLDEPLHRLLFAQVSQGVGHPVHRRITYMSRIAEQRGFDDLTRVVRAGDVASASPGELGDVWRTVLENPGVPVDVAVDMALSPPHA